MHPTAVLRRGIGGAPSPSLGVGQADQGGDGAGQVGRRSVQSRHERTGGRPTRGRRQAETGQLREAVTGECQSVFQAQQTRLVIASVTATRRARQGGHNRCGHGPGRDSREELCRCAAAPPSPVPGRAGSVSVYRLHRETFGGLRCGVDIHLDQLSLPASSLATCSGAVG